MPETNAKASSQPTGGEGQGFFAKFERFHDELYKPIGNFFDGVDAALSGLFKLVAPLLGGVAMLAVAVSILWGFIALVHAVWRAT